MIRYGVALKAFLTDRRALTALEYGLIGSIIFAAIFAGFLQMANSLSHQFSNVGGSL